ncbi:hypothetical protein ES703_21200 [subsurface metagenome]
MPTNIKIVIIYLMQGGEGKRKPERHLKVTQQVLRQLPERYTRGATGLTLSQPHPNYTTEEKDVKVYVKW